MDPEELLMDELLSVLDMMTQDRMLFDILYLQDEHPKCILSLQIERTGLAIVEAETADEMDAVVVGDPNVKWISRYSKCI